MPAQVAIRNVPFELEMLAVGLRRLMLANATGKPLLDHADNFSALTLQWQRCPIQNGHSVLAEADTHTLYVACFHTAL